MKQQCGGDQAFNQAVEDGDVWSAQNKDGKTLWYTAQAKSVHRSGKTERTVLNKGQKKLTQAESNALVEILDTYSWSVPQSAKDKQLALKGNDEVLFEPRTVWTTDSFSNSTI